MSPKASIHAPRELWWKCCLWWHFSGIYLSDPVDKHDRRFGPNLASPVTVVKCFLFKDLFGLFGPLLMTGQWDRESKWERDTRGRFCKGPGLNSNPVRRCSCAVLPYCLSHGRVWWNVFRIVVVLCPVHPLIVLPFTYGLVILWRSWRFITQRQKVTLWGPKIQCLFWVMYCIDA